jgi:16S rRNA pseudouridine516 synthase
LKSQRWRLDRFIAKQENLSLREVRQRIVQGRVMLDGVRASAISQLVEQFSRVTLDDRVLQDSQAHYVMLHKPAGVVSATKDDQHSTAIDLLTQPYTKTLHIAGRLDFNSTGLLLLTNDGRWSRALSEPSSGTFKTYQVRVEKPLNEEYVEAFSKGMHFSFEGITTRPAQLNLISEYEAEVRLVEGRYHQIKRMFGRFDNRVTHLHRIAVGNLTLDPALGEGESRELYETELHQLGIEYSAAQQDQPQD